jgi:hypothetical protein
MPRVTKTLLSAALAIGLLFGQALPALACGSLVARVPQGTGRRAVHLEAATHAGAD